jgi:hypothetical protein
MKLQYKLTGTGWAQATVEAEGRKIDLTASYLSDPLAEITAAAIALLKGAREVRFSFDDEPGEYRWIIVAEGVEVIGLTILEFPELWGNKPDDRGKVLLNTRSTRKEFAAEVLEVLDQIKTTLGETQYKEQWVQSDFPSERHNALKALLT